MHLLERAITSGPGHRRARRSSNGGGPGLRRTVALLSALIAVAALQSGSPPRARADSAPADPTNPKTPPTVAIDRLPFLQRGLLPLASLTSTIPLVAVAPIMVMWFGFEWPSKAAVVVLMTFFPMLVATLAGLQAAGRIERELMHSYAAGYARTLLWLRLPCAVPFIMSALKVNATLALIGAIVAEFFGSPTVGLGFRISTEAAKMNMSLVWGAIVVAAVTGSLAYALLVQLERRWAFWHPSVRSR